MTWRHGFGLLTGGFLDGTREEILYLDCFLRELCRAFESGDGGFYPQAGEYRSLNVSGFQYKGGA